MSIWDKILDGGLGLGQAYIAGQGNQPIKVAQPAQASPGMSQKTMLMIGGGALLALIVLIFALKK